MTSIDFYFNAADKYQVACRLAGKAMKQDLRMLIYAPQADAAQKIDRMLWTWPATGFVPHCMSGDALAPDTPVLIAPEIDAEPGCSVLLNLSSECAPRFERFERVLEIVSQDDADRAAGRSRFRFYRERGYVINSHDLGSEVARDE